MWGVSARDRATVAARRQGQTTAKIASYNSMWTSSNSFLIANRGIKSRT